MQGLFITGTDTGVGKTFIAAAIARHLKQINIRVVPRKPVESGCDIKNDLPVPRDAEILKQAADYQGPLEDVCRYRFQAPVSPLRAARLDSRFITIEQLAQSCQPGDDQDFLLVEGAGGFYSPLAENGLNADLASTLQLPVLLVTDDRLGVINQVLLNAEAMQQRDLYLMGVVLNTTNSAQNEALDNLTDLKEYLHCPVWSSPFTEDGNAKLPGELIDLLTESLTGKHMPAHFQPVYQRW